MHKFQLNFSRNFRIEKLIQHLEAEITKFLEQLENV